MRLANYLKTKKSILDEHTFEVLKKALPSVFVKIFGIISSIILSVFLGRKLGAEGLGIINLSSRVINILILFGLFGSRLIVIKEISIAKSRKNFQRVGDVMKSALWFNGGITLMLSILMILISPWLANRIFNEPNLTYPLMILLVVTTPQILSRIYSAGLTGYKKIWQSNVVDNVLSIVVAGILILIGWFVCLEINIVNVAICYAIGRIVVTFTVGLYWRHINIGNEIKANFISMQIFKKTYLFFVISASSVVMSNIDVLLLGVLTDSKSIGLYTVAARIALMTKFFHMITCSAISPKIAALYANRQEKELGKMVKKVTMGLSLMGLITLLILILFGESILGIWGSEFKNAYWILVIIGIGQFVNFATGAVGIILAMTGHEKTLSQISVISLFLVIILNVFLIKLYGIVGAAISTSSVVIGENVVKFLLVKYKLKLTV